MRTGDSPKLDCRNAIDGLVSYVGLRDAVARCNPADPRRHPRIGRTGTDDSRLAGGTGLMRWHDRVYGSVAHRRPGDPRPDRLSDLPAAQGSPPGRALGAGLPVQECHPVRAQPGRLPPAAPPRRRPPRAGRRPAPRHLAHGVLARGRLHLLLAGAGPSRAAQAADARPSRHRRGARPAGLSRRPTSTTTRSTPCSSSRCPGSAPTGSTTSSATAWPAASCTPEAADRILAHLAVADDRDRLDRRRRRPRGRRTLRRHEPRLVGQRHRSLHLQRVRRRPPRRPCDPASSARTT